MQNWCYWGYSIYIRIDHLPQLSLLICCRWCRMWFQFQIFLNLLYYKTKIKIIITNFRKGLSRSRYNSKQGSYSIMIFCKFLQLICLSVKVFGFNFSYDSWKFMKSTPISKSIKKYEQTNMNITENARYKIWFWSFIGPFSEESINVNT